MKFFDKLFKKKIPEEKDELEEVKLYEGSLPECGQCGNKIYPGELGIIKFPKSGKESKKYHKKCFRKLRRLAKHYQAYGKLS